MIEAFVGAGGKTTTLFAHAKACHQAKKKVLVLTSTHMMQEEDTFVYEPRYPKEEQMKAMLEQLEKHGYLMAGTKAKDAKIAALPKDMRDALMQKADVVLIEADGSKRMPLKYPDWSKEPVLDFEPDVIFVLAGCTGLYKPVSQSVFRHELACENLGWSTDTCMDEIKLLQLLKQGYLKELAKRKPKSQICIALTCGDEKLRSFLENELKPIKVILL